MPGTVGQEGVEHDDANDAPANAAVDTPMKLRLDNLLLIDDLICFDLI